MKNDAKSNVQDGKKREIAYPVYGLEEAVKIAAAVRDLGGARTPVAKTLLAKHLKYAETGPSFVGRLASAKFFQLIRGWGSYSLTETAQRYFYPTNASDKTIAAASFLKAQPVFAKIVTRFNGDPLPSAEMLGNTLHNESGIPASWKDKVAGIFISSAQFAGVLDSAGCLRCNEALQESPNIPVESVQKEENSTQPQAQPHAIRHPKGDNLLNADSKRWSLTEDNRTVFIEHPRDIKCQEWESLNQYVQRIKPEDKTK
jgi:hypothetical protein